MENKKLTNPVEMTEKALDLVAGGNDTLMKSPSLPADAYPFPAPLSGTNTVCPDDLVQVCALCHQRKSADILYPYQGKKYCYACITSLG